MNTEAVRSPTNRWQRSWLAVLTGIVAHIGVSTLLVYVVIIGGDALTAFIEPHHLDWIHRLDDPASGGWFVLQAISLISGLSSGLVAIAMSPPRSRVAIGILLLLAVGTVFFAQLPSPRSAMVIAIWSLATPVGLLLGAYIGRNREHAA